MDFLSNAGRGLPPRGPERTWPEPHTGLSVIDTVERAAETARRLPFARAICELEIPDGGPIRIRKTLGPATTPCGATPIRCSRAGAGCCRVPMGAPDRGQYEGPSGVSVVDAETHNAIGYYRTEDDALLDVTDVVAEHGRHSAEARNFLMYRDGSESGALGGNALIDRALERTLHPEPRPAH